MFLSGDERCHGVIVSLVGALHTRLSELNHRPEMMRRSASALAALMVMMRSPKISATFARFLSSKNLRFVKFLRN